MTIETNRAEATRRAVAADGDDAGRSHTGEEEARE